MTMFLRHRNGPRQEAGHFSGDEHHWFDELRQRWLPVFGDQEILTIEMEDINALGWLASLFATVTAPGGEAYSWFVGHVTSADPRWPTYRIESDSFPRMRNLPDSIPPEEAWAPGMTAALRELRERLESQGWREIRKGERPWEYTYVRPRIDWPDD